MFALANLARAIEPDSAATLVFRSAVIETMDTKRPTATAIAIRHDRILAVGSFEKIERHIVKATQVIDLDGRLVVPGFIESHGHFLGLGKFLLELDLMDSDSWRDVVSKVAREVQGMDRGVWIIGRGWHQSLWKEKPQPNIEGYPFHDDLSAVTPNNPVLLIHRSGHLCLANKLAMELAGVDSKTQAPRGGEILRNSTGEPAGVFRETAQNLIQRAHARFRQDLSLGDLDREFTSHVKLAEQQCLRFGVTSFQDAGVSPATARKFAELIGRGRLQIRLWLMLRSSNSVLRQQIPSLAKYHEFANHHLTIGGIKQMVDGALGAHGAWLLEPYADLPSSHGLVVTPLDTIRETARIAFEHDLQLCTHAIGDRANHEMLNLYAEFVTLAGDRQLRWRIEHAQHIATSDIPRFGKLGIIASMQANHATSDGPFVAARLGDERSRAGAYVWQSLLKSGAVIANGTDTPVEPINPIACLYSAVTRRMKNGEVFYAEQVMTRRQALRSYTLDAAFAAFQEDEKGSLVAGKLADMVVLSRNIMTIDADNVRSAQVDITVVGGEILFRR
jgi:predicted amidohydrolase YtcJ